MKYIVLSILILSSFYVSCQQTLNESGNLTQLLAQSDPWSFVDKTAESSPFTDDYTFESKKTEVIKTIVSDLYSARLIGKVAPLSRKQKRIYNSLVKSDKKNIETILVVRLQKMHNDLLSTKRCQDSL